MIVRALLWDFGDTLADERWMHAPMPGAARWSDLYRSFSAGSDLVDRWNTGAADWIEVASWFAAQLGVEVEQVRDHMEKCCKSIAFFPLVGEVSARCGLPQAIVTINPDVFSTIVVTTYGLADRFDPIVASWQARTLDKSDLCDLALAGWGGQFAREECLLIDNRPENVEAWRGKGGASYHFRNEHDLQVDFPALISSTTAG